MINNDLSNIVLGTGNYQNVKSGNTVSVTGDGGNAWGYYGNSYKKLAPRLVTYKKYALKYEKLVKYKENTLEYIEFRRQIEDEYISSYYETRLKNLDVIDLLKTLENKFGSNIILLCHEELCEFCHRRLIADYIEIKTGIYIPEVKVNEEGLVKKINPIRYKNRLNCIINKK